MATVWHRFHDPGLLPENLQLLQDKLQDINAYCGSDFNTYWLWWNFKQPREAGNQPPTEESIVYIFSTFSSLHVKYQFDTIPACQISVNILNIRCPRLITSLYIVRVCRPDFAAADRCLTPLCKLQFLICKNPHCCQGSCMCRRSCLELLYCCRSLYRSYRLARCISDGGPKAALCIATSPWGPWQSVGTWRAVKRTGSSSRFLSCLLIFAD